MRTCFQSALVGIWLLGAAPALSQPKQKIPSEDLQKAKAHFGEAEAFYRVGEYEKALEGYKEAYLLSKKPAILFNMAQCYRYLKRYREARKTYQLFLADDPKTEFRDEVEGFLAELDALIAAEPTTQPATTPVVDVRPPETQPTTAPTPPATQIVANTAVTLPVEPSIPEPKAPKPVLFFAGAAAGGALSLLFGGASLSKASDARELQAESISDPNDPRVSEILHTYQSARRLGATSDLLLVSSALVAGAGVYLMWKGKQAEASLQVNRSAVAVQVRF